MELTSVTVQTMCCHVTVWNFSTQMLNTTLGTSGKVLSSGPSCSVMVAGFCADPSKSIEILLHSCFMCVAKAQNLEKINFL